MMMKMGTPMGAGTLEENLKKAGFVNHAGEAPILVEKQKDPDNTRLVILDFDPSGIPLNEWVDTKERIETAHNMTIVKMEWADGWRIVRVYAVPAGNTFPEKIKWDEKYLSKDNFELVLGESLLGMATVNLANIPHILLGGSTGSGKSVLLKLLLMQAYHKGAEIFIADFKGGVDYPKIWHYKCWMCFNEQDVLNLLKDMVQELERRKGLFRDAGCANIDEFNQIGNEHLKRWVFGCDEVAEVLDKSGHSKEEKELLSQIESKLATIARQGRAFGIHLILATQRPDANILPGQIKNNVDFRVCGRADMVLSQIVLDNTSAADQIPKDAKGRFITGDGTVFQAYLPDENQL